MADQGAPLGRQQLIVILGAFVGGVLMFAVVAGVLVVTQGGGFAPGPPLDLVLPLLTGGVVVATAVASFVVAKVFVRTARAAALGAASVDDAEVLVDRVFAQKVLVQGALAEGAALLAVVSFLLTGQWWVLLIGAVRLVDFAVIFPTEARRAAFLRDAAGG